MQLERALPRAPFSLKRCPPLWPERDQLSAARPSFLFPAASPAASFILVSDMVRVISLHFGSKMGPLSFTEQPGLASVHEVLNVASGRTGSW